MTGSPPARTFGPLTRTDFVRYQGASGDMQPIHHDEPFARSAGYDAPLAIGMLTAGYLATYATDWLGAESIRSFRARFVERAWPGDELTCVGRIVGERVDAGRPVLDIELSATRQTGDVTVRAWATFEAGRA